MNSKRELNQHYLEAYHGDKEQPIYLGHLNDIGRFRDSVLYDEHSEHLGNIFCPERDVDGYSYEKNICWMLGGIEGSRKFILLSDFTHYEDHIANKIERAEYYKNSDRALKKSDVVNRGKKIPGTIENIGVTLDELRWLYDFGYTFEVSSTQKKHTLAIPPKELTSVPILEYCGLMGNSCEDDVLTELKKLQTMLDDIADQRIQSQHKVAPSARRTLNDSYSLKPDFSSVLLLAPKEEVDDQAKFSSSTVNKSKSPLLSYSASPQLKNISEVDNEKCWVTMTKKNQKNTERSMAPAVNYKKSFFPPPTKSRADEDLNWRQRKTFDKNVTN